MFLRLFCLYQRRKLQKRQCVLEHVSGRRSRVEGFKTSSVIL